MSIAVAQSEEYLTAPIRQAYLLFIVTYFTLLYICFQSIVLQLVTII